MKASRKGSVKGLEIGRSGRSAAGARDKTGGSVNQNAEADYLDGQMLIAMPVMDDERFQRSVIYVCAHSSEGAMGIIVNQPAGSIDFPGLLMQLDIIKKDERIALPRECRGHEGAEWRAGRDRARLRAAFERLLHRELDAADRRGHFADRDARYPESDCDRRRTGTRDSGAWICRLGAGPAGERNPAQWLAALSGRPRSRCSARTSTANTSAH